jgi:Ca-activated chloride channel family protein
VTQGALRIVQPNGGIVECPLKHTDVAADISGFIARVRVTQTFHNPTKEKIEAVYVFPLPHEAAVDEMTMVVGERKIVGLIKRRAEARSIYEQALRSGQTAALLEQERPNIFTQSVGNIEPGQEVKIEISYVDALRYDMGTYEFHFPMVVGPRYIPGAPTASPEPRAAELQGKVSPPVPDTNRVPDASRISPPVLKPGVRNGHDISLSVKLDAGVPIQNLKSANHEAAITRDGARAAAIKLSPADSVPNKDFVLRYGVVGKKPEMALLAHTGDYSADRRQLGNGYFMLMIQPQEDERLTKSPPREIVFLVDVSGSMSGEPTAKVIDAMQGMLKLCRPQDTLQVITFASQAHKLFERPVPVNEENIGKALGFTSALQGSGGTEMLKGVQLAIDEPIDNERLRIVVMLTDGYIGNEAEIIEHVGKHCGDQIRFWCVGIGSSPNMFLVDGVARQGGGMGKKLELKQESQPLVQEIMTRIQRAQLAKVRVDWSDLKVSETYPAKIPELWAGRPVIIYGRYASGGPARITVSGSVEGEPVSWPLNVELPAERRDSDVLAKVRARQKVEDLMQQTYYAGSPAIEEMVTAIALDYRLMSQYTSFVAVDEKQAESSEPARPPRRMLVPVPLPEGTRWEGFFGPLDGELDLADSLSLLPALDKKSIDVLSRSGATAAGIAGRPLAEPAQASAPQRLRLSRLSAEMAPGGSGPAAGYGRRLAGGAFGVQGQVAGGYGGAVQLGQLMAGEAKISGRFRGVNGRARFDGVQKLHEELGAVTESRFAEAALAGRGEKSAEAAKTVFESATAKEPPAKGETLRRLLIRACLLDNAAANLGQSDGSIAAQAIERLNQLHDQDVEAWAARLPQLKSKLDLVIRDQSLSEALAQIGRAAQLEVRLLDGSLDDSAAIVGEQPRIGYLDLRRATVAQALDWILQPTRLTWWAAAEGIVAGSDRRREGESGWVYDVAAIALPLEEDLAKLNDHAKAVEEIGKAADSFLAAVRRSLGVADESVVAWFAPGQLLVFAAPERHTAMAQLIESLKEGKDQPNRVGAELVDASRKRYAARKENFAKAQAAQRKLGVALAHDRFSWQLVAAAAGGQLDVEALTELQIAWKNAETSDLLGGPARPLLLRSLWAIRHAAKMLPQEQELLELQAAARKQAQGAIEAALAEAQKESADQAALLGVLYAAMANPDDRAYVAKAMPLLAGKEGDDPAAAELRVLGRLLLSQPAEADRKALEELVTRGVTGADRVALTALACRKLGGQFWHAFRAQSRELLGNQPLAGEVVVLINRLATTDL